MKLSSLKQLSHSELRHRVLAALSLEPASSVTSLAQKLGVLRPSASRTVRSLQDAGLITRTGRAISLSGAGHEELRRLDAELAMKVKKDTDLATRVLLEQAAEAARQLEPIVNSHIMESLVNSPLVKLSEELANSPLLQVGKALANSAALQTAKVLADNTAFQAMEAINATAHIQTINLELLQNWHLEIPSPLNHLILENNVLLGNMMVDLEAISEIRAQVSEALANLINQTAWTTKAYDTYFADIVSGFSQIPTFDQLDLSLAIPTTAAASLVGSTRCIVELEAVPHTEKGPKPSYTARAQVHLPLRDGVLTEKLETYLQPLGQRFIDKWEGAWQTLYSGNKDRHSQATHSGRELLMQVLAYLAPDEVFSKEDCIKHGVDKPTRKMRIKYILGYECRSSVELIESMANTLDCMYDVLMREAHKRDDKSPLDDTIAGQLGALGASLIMLLSLHSNIHW